MKKKRPGFKNGVPHFLTYTHLTPTPHAPVKLTNYRDDITITSTHNEINITNASIQSYLHEIHTWFQTNNLMLTLFTILYPHSSMLPPYGHHMVTTSTRHKHKKLQITQNTALRRATGCTTNTETKAYKRWNCQVIHPSKPFSRRFSGSESVCRG